MKIGVIADTHDRLEKIEKAVAFFNSNDLDLIIHAGDYIAPFTARIFADLQIKMAGIFGNNDGDKKELIKAYKGIADIHEPPYRFNVEKKSIVVVHLNKHLDLLFDNNDIVIYAHTHQYEVTSKKDNKLLINPGECCGYLSGMSSVVIMDTKTMEANIFDLQ